MSTPNYNFPLIKRSDTADVPRDLNALANTVDAKLKQEITRVEQGVNNIGLVTQDKDGLMRHPDKRKLDGIADGANKTVLNNTLNSTSTTEAATATDKGDKQ